MEKFQVISPADNSVYVEREYASANQVHAALETAKLAQKAWAQYKLDARAQICYRFIEYFQLNQSQIAEEISWQMGRPKQQALGEIVGLIERSKVMIAFADAGLADIIPNPKEDFKRYIRREPKGVVFVIAPWNYPYITAANTIVPAIMAGNAVILKHSTQTPLCAEQFAKAFAYAGLPEDIFQFLHLTHQDAASLAEQPDIHYVAFTGSVAGGFSMQQALLGRFTGLGLELGGKDPAYVRLDANLEYAVANLVDGVYYNSGQSCCGIERIYVQETVYDAFVAAFVEKAKQYQLGNPLEKGVTLGPMVSTLAADVVRQQIDAAVKAKAKTLIDPKIFPNAIENTPYLAPQVLVNVDHSMALMREENFGPVVGIMSVKDDVQAIEFMNDNRYGLTASVWTRDLALAEAMGEEVRVGTWFMNRCDYLDPALAWTGVKDSGMGCSLSILGYEPLTQLKSYHLKTVEF